VTYPADEEESSGIDEGSSPSAETRASNSLLQQNPVISKNLRAVRVTEDDESLNQNSSRKCQSI
jgi:hypothetical protein